jgi:Glycine zipper
MLPLYIRQGTCHFDELWLLSSASAGVKWLCEGTVWRLPLVVEENVSRYIVSCLDYAREHEDGRVFTQRRRVRWRATADQPTHFFRHISPTSKCNAPQHSCLSLFIGSCEVVDLFGTSLAIRIVQSECKTQWEVTMIRKSALTHSALIFFLAGFVGCSTPLTTREKGAGIGALGGAAAGGIIGSTVGSAGAGAAIGGLLGLGAGALIGDQLQGRDMKQDEQQQRIDQSQRELERQRREIERLKQGEY